MKLQHLPPRLAPPRPRMAPPAKIVDPFYVSREWRELVGLVKAQRGYVCEACGADMRSNRRALIGDHIVERKDGGADLDPLNVQCLCLPCHNRKTARTKAERPAGWR